MSRHPARTVLPLTVLILALLGPASAARADVRLASPTSVDTTGTCLITACRLDRALAVAQPGDEVALEDGVPYSVSYEAKATNAVTIRPAVPGTRPRLVGTSGLGFPTLTLAAGGTVRGLRIETSSVAALSLAGGARGIGLELFAASTPSTDFAAKLYSAPGTTALINSVAKTAGVDSAIEIFEGAPAGGASIVNVTAILTGGNGWGITTELMTQSPVVKNSIVRSTAKPLHGRSGSLPILASNTNFFVGSSANWTDVANNQQDVAVTFADEAAGDYRVPAGQPTIDAGATDALITATADPDFHGRSLGAGPDIGAYEYDPTPPAAPTPDPDPTPDPGAGTTDTSSGTTSGATTTGKTTTTTTVITPDGDEITYEVRADGTPILPDAAQPILGESVTVDTAGGKPLIRLPGSKRYVPLTSTASIPVGSTVDVTTSRITLTSVRDGQGRTQTGEFWGGRFIVRQTKAKTPYTDLVLTGGSFAGCPKRTAKARKASVTAYVAAGKKKRVRSLWGRDDKGRFRTRGRNSVATVRGTVWLVQDRCDGTLTRVTKGAVDVRETRSGRVVRLRAGRSHLARAR